MFNTITKAIFGNPTNDDLVTVITECDIGAKYVGVQLSNPVTFQVSKDENATKKCGKNVIRNTDLISMSPDCNNWHDQFSQFIAEQNINNLTVKLNLLNFKEDISPIMDFLAEQKVKGLIITNLCPRLLGEDQTLIIPESCKYVSIECRKYDWRDDETSSDLSCIINFGKSQPVDVCLDNTIVTKLPPSIHALKCTLTDLVNVTLPPNLDYFFYEQVSEYMPKGVHHLMLSEHSTSIPEGLLGISTGPTTFDFVIPPTMKAFMAGHRFMGKVSGLDNLITLYTGSWWTQFIGALPEGMRYFCHDSTYSECPNLNEGLLHFQSEHAIRRDLVIPKTVTHVEVQHCKEFTFVAQPIFCADYNDYPSDVVNTYCYDLGDMSSIHRYCTNATPTLFDKKVLGYHVVESTNPTITSFKYDDEGVLVGEGEYLTNEEVQKGKVLDFYGCKGENFGTPMIDAIQFQPDVIHLWNGKGYLRQSVHSQKSCNYGIGDRGPRYVSAEEDYSYEPKEGEHLVQYNGGPVYRMTIDDGEVVVYGSASDKRWGDAPKNLTKEVYRGTPINIMYGSCPRNSNWSNNTFLLHVGENEYIHVSNTIFKFTTDSPITEFVSEMGNSCVPYPLAYTATRTYLLSFEHYYLNSDIPSNTPKYGETDLIHAEFEPEQHTYDREVIHNAW